MQNKKLILVIDDYEPIRTFVKLILEEKDFEVDSCSNYRDALEIIQKRKPDLIISDLIGHDGTNGVSFYVRHIMESKINFAIWTGSLDFTRKEHLRQFDIFLQGIPDYFKITYDTDLAFLKKEIELVIDNSRDMTKSVVPMFQKPDMLEKILKYYGL